MKLTSLLTLIFLILPQVTLAVSETEHCKYCRENCVARDMSFGQWYCNMGEDDPAPCKQLQMEVEGDCFDLQQACRKILGSYSELDWGGDCRCRPGFVPDEFGRCFFVEDLGQEVPDRSVQRMLQEWEEMKIEEEPPKEELPPFIDVPPTHQYITAVNWAQENNIVSGYPDGTFRPDQVVIRAEFLKIILKTADADTFSVTEPAGFPDIDEGAWYGTYVRYAKKHNVVQGYPDGFFRPERPVNFAEALKMAYLALDLDSPESGGQWYERFISHAKSNDFLFTHAIAPGDGLTRKDLVWIVWKMKQYIDS